MRITTVVMCAAFLAGCQDIREIITVTYVIGDGCSAVRGLDDGSSIDGNGDIEVSAPTQSGNGGITTSHILDRVLVSNVRCE